MFLWNNFGRKLLMRPPESNIDVIMAAGSDGHKDESQTSSQAEVGSVWWVELLMGSVCIMLATIYWTSYTNLGLLTYIAVNYHPILGVVVSGIAVMIGYVFIDSGLTSFRESALSE